MTAELRSKQDNQSCILIKFVGNNKLYIIDRTAGHFAGLPEELLLGWYAPLYDGTNAAECPEFEKYKAVYEAYMPQNFVLNANTIYVRNGNLQTGAAAPAVTANAWQDAPKPQFGASPNEVDGLFIEAEEQIKEHNNFDLARKLVGSAVALLRIVNPEAMDQSGTPIAATVDQPRVAIWVLERLKDKKLLEGDRCALGLLAALRDGETGLALKKACGYTTDIPVHATENSFYGNGKLSENGRAWINGYASQYGSTPELIEIFAGVRLHVFDADVLFKVLGIDRDLAVPLVNELQASIDMASPEEVDNVITPDLTIGLGTNNTADSSGGDDVTAQVYQAMREAQELVAGVGSQRPEDVARGNPAPTANEFDLTTPAPILRQQRELLLAERQALSDTIEGLEEASEPTALAAGQIENVSGRLEDARRRMQALEEEIARIAALLRHAVISEQIQGPVVQGKTYTGQDADEKALATIEYLKKLAETGFGRNFVPPAKKRKLIVPLSFYANNVDEFRKHAKRYEGCFNLEWAGDGSLADYVDSVIRKAGSNPQDAVVLVPIDECAGIDESVKKELTKLAKAGISYVPTSWGLLHSVDYQNNEADRVNFQEETYAVMFLARNLENVPVDSPLYDTMRRMREFMEFYLKTHFAYTGGIGPKEYIEALIRNNVDDVSVLVNGMLIYRPSHPYDKEEIREKYKGLTEPLIRA